MMSDNKHHADSNDTSEFKIIKDPITGAETTGHVWDDNIREFNNPLPRWWLWAFYATIVFSIVYWVIYPSWPTGFAERGFIPGTKTITYKGDLMVDGKRVIAGGKEHTVAWNTRALLAHQMQNDPNELKRQAMVKQITSMPVADVVTNADHSAFVLAYGKGIFGDYCAGCHQAGGQGIIGHYPNLIDDAWLWGGESADIELSIRKGHKGNMPAHKASLSDAQITQAAHYVLSLSGENADVNLAAQGKKIYDTKGCSGCHTPTGVGMKALGAANLTDKIWTQANVPGASNIGEKVVVVKQVIANGIKREMPAWESRLSNEEIKVLVAYLKLQSSK